MWIVLLIAGLNTAISLYYYLRVVKIMTIDPEPDTRRPASLSYIPGTFVVLVSCRLIILGIWPGEPESLARVATGQLF